MFVLLVSFAFAEDPAPIDRPPGSAGAVADDPYVTELVAWLESGGAPAAEAPEIAANMALFERSLPWETGAVSLREGTIALQLGEGDRYVGPESTSRILELWGNPPDPDTDGLVVPAGTHLFGAGSWAVLVRYIEDGWVDDSEAASIDYDELLASMQEGQESGNDERRKLGLDALTMSGWAESPHYDAPSHVLYWATLLRAESGNATLNYDVRVLGRRGVLSLNALADEKDLERIKTGMERVRTVASFAEGSRYADYVPGSDAKAAYGIAALVAGGAIAAKTGMFKGLLVLLLASKKLLIVGALAIAGAARSFWAKISGRAQEQ